MEKALIGAGGFSREIKAQMGNYSMKCFVDDKYWEENNENIFPLSQFDCKKYEILVAIGDSKDRHDLIQRLPKETKYFTFIHDSVQILGNDFTIGEGSIVCAGCIITTNVSIGKHTQLNLQTTIGHDCRIGDFFTTAPGVKISGNCKINDCVYIGTNSSIKEKISIHSLSIIGMNSGVVKNIYESGVYVGTPAKLINK
jgi:sugar O-acyltransferase (sialic acid O-acetyltransferase NeuD family)